MGMNKPKKRALQVVAHIILWFIFLSLPAIFNFRRHGIGLFRFTDDLLEPPRWTNGLLLIIVFYFNYYIGIPKLYFNRKYFLLFLSFIVCFGLYFLLNYAMIPPELRYKPTNEYTALGNSFNFFMFIIVYSFSFAICLYEQWQKTKEQMLNTEISFLKAQINPHFLFNTLNSIYSLALTKSDKAPDAIVKLSGMMRYSVSDANQNFVSLSKELDYISNYIDLQKLRLTDRVKISFEVSGSEEGKQVAPFLLIPFIENAFKHGVNTEEDSDIRIGIEINDFDLHLHVSNNKVFMRPDIAHGEGLGINTTRQRLILLYPGHHELKVMDKEKQFIVSLKIDYK